MESTLYSVTSKCSLAILSLKWNFLVHYTLQYGGIISSLRGIKCLFVSPDKFISKALWLYLLLFSVILALFAISHTEEIPICLRTFALTEPCSLVTCGTVSHLLQDFAQMPSFPWALILSHLAFHSPIPITTCSSPKHWANSNMWYYITYIFIMFIFFGLFPPSTSSRNTKCFWLFCSLMWIYFC